MNRETLICECGSLEHQFSFYRDEDNRLICSVHLADYQNIFKRIITAIKYIFGYKCRYGNFDEFYFSEIAERQLIGEKVISCLPTYEEVEKNVKEYEEYSKEKQGVDYIYNDVITQIELKLGYNRGDFDNW